MSKYYGPQRIVCLTEETTETLYLLGEDRRIVGANAPASKRLAKAPPPVSQAERNSGAWKIARGTPICADQLVAAERR